MAKRIKSKPKHPQGKWSSKNEISLLAWLDHTLQHDEVDFQKTAVKHLGNVFNSRQIDGKLWRLWHLCGPDVPAGISPRRWRKDKSIYDHGSACLVGLSENDKRDIAATTQLLEDEFMANRIAAASQHHLRSASKLDRSSSIPDFGSWPRSISSEEPRINASKFTISSPSRLPVKQNTKNTRALSSQPTPPSKRQKILPRKNPEKPKSNLRSSKRKEKNMSSSKTAASSLLIIDETDDTHTDDSLSTLSITPDIEMRHIPKIQDIDYPIHRATLGTNSAETQVPEEASKETQRKPISGKKELEAEVAPDQVCDGCQVRLPTRNLKRFCEHCSHERLQTLNRPILPDDLPTQVTGQRNDGRLQSVYSKIEILEEQLREKEDALKVENEALKAKEQELSFLNAAARKRDLLLSWPMEKVIADHLKETKKLNLQLNNRTLWGTFTNLKSTSRDRFSTRHADDCFQALYAQAEDIPLYHNSGTKLSIPPLEQHATLKRLVDQMLRANDVDIDSVQAQTALAKILLLGPRALVRSLTNSALQDWVFETEFPQFDDEESKILRSYRIALLEQDGPVALRNLDLAALVPSIRDEIFQNRTIPKKAKELAIELSHALAPLYSNAPQNIPDTSCDGFATWDSDQETASERENCLTQLFIEALKTKAETCLNIEDYEMVTFPPGTKYDKNAMDVETKDGIHCRTGNFEGRSIELCIQAAVYSYQRKELSSNASVAEAVIPWVVTSPFHSLNFYLILPLEYNKLLISKRDRRIYVAPGNGGTAQGLAKVSNLQRVDEEDFDVLVQLSKDLNINLVVPGPDVPIVTALKLIFVLVNMDYSKYIPFLTAKLEGSKAFLKDFMARHNIPTAAYRNFTDYEIARKYLEGIDFKVVLKASGLATGKGVIIPETKDDALKAIREIMLEQQFGDAGNEVVIEEFLEGDELSILNFSDGVTFKSMPPAQDHKRIFDHDLGPNTGGMGCYAPTKIASPAVLETIENSILKPTFEGLRQEGNAFVGLLFTGIMLTKTGPKAVEYSARFGDPETQTLLPLLKTDLATLMVACVQGRLHEMNIEMYNKFGAVVIISAAGYPSSYSKGDRVEMENRHASGGVLFFHTGTSLEDDGTLVTAGGRVLAVSATASTLEHAVGDAYQGVSTVKFKGMHYRTDIAYR
ncbi:Bifunctional purine biosynthetic protein [Lachnellula subtilissima]|uniref:phosphoribosylamine--glycine ligase n=1 Tax=Lachnellula subtilissima TaxID=602034 RepID=A0A8H8RQ05_9HELO|nr:Bifunctional purine biosynthetic protein [Lachnellula subtilissima]